MTNTCLTFLYVIWFCKPLESFLGEVLSVQTAKQKKLFLTTFRNRFLKIRTFTHDSKTRQICGVCSSGMLHCITRELVCNTSKQHDGLMSKMWLYVVHSVHNTWTYTSNISFTSNIDVILQPTWYDTVQVVGKEAI